MGLHMAEEALSCWISRDGRWQSTPGSRVWGKGLRLGFRPPTQLSGSLSWNRLPREVKASCGFRMGCSAVKGGKGETPSTPATATGPSCRLLDKDLSASRGSKTRKEMNYSRAR